MFDDDDPTESAAPGDDPAPAISTPPVATLPPADVRSSPEYRTQANENRRLARENGRLRAEAEASRVAAEEARLAAEATQQAAQEQAIAEVLGDAGVEAWNEIVELSQTDPVAAATRMAELMQSAPAQSLPAPTAEPPAAAPPAGEGTPSVTDQPPRSVDGDAPLAPPPTDETEQLIGTLNKQFTDTAAKVQNPVTRGRTTMRERATALIGYVAGEYLRQGARPKGDRS